MSEYHVGMNDPHLGLLVHIGKPKRILCLMIDRVERKQYMTYVLLCVKSPDGLLRKARFIVKAGERYHPDSLAGYDWKSVPITDAQEWPRPSDGKETSP